MSPRNTARLVSQLPLPLLSPVAALGHDGGLPGKEPSTIRVPATERRHQASGAFPNEAYGQRVCSLLVQAL